MTQLFIFDDARARRWEPFSLTRPIGEILFGCLRLGERAGRRWSLPVQGQIVETELAGFTEDAATTLVTPDAPPRDRIRILLSSRAIVDGPLKLPEPGSHAQALMIEDETVGWILPVGVENPPLEALLHPESWSEPEGPSGPFTLDGQVLGWPWELVDRMPTQIARDIEWLYPRDNALLPTGVGRLGTDVISMDESVTIEPGVLLDSSNGPIRLDAGVRLQAGTRLAGPSFVGPGTALLGGTFEAISVGPVCKLRGELEASVVLGYTNKAHDGFIGHAILGRWVNLGALTTNSDLKNTYGSVRVHLSDGSIDTGLPKVGAFLGDHVKTGIGTLLPTGALIGAGTSVFLGGVTPVRLPAFSWVTPDGIDRFRVDRFLEIAAKVMNRRNVELSPEHGAMLSRAWDRSVKE